MSQLEVDLAAPLEDALVQLRVLVGDGPRIVHADRLEHAAPECAERHGVGEALRAGGAVGRPAHAERALQRGAEGPLEGCPRERPRDAAGVLGVRAREHLHALAHVVGGIHAVDVRAHDHVSTARADGGVQPGRLDALRVVDDAYPRILPDDPAQDLQGAVGAPAVGDHNLHPIHGVVLLPEGRDERSTYSLSLRHGTATVTKHASSPDRPPRLARRLPESLVMVV